MVPVVYCCMFVLGLGAQKAGSGWFYKQVAKAEGFISFGGTKEVHYWDHVYQLNRLRPTDANSIEGWFSSEIAPSYQREGAVGEDYFESVRTATSTSWGLRQRPSVTADITPAYSGLPLVAWRTIFSGLLSRDIDFRVVYFLRDPVDRICSALNMEIRRRRLYEGLTDCELSKTFNDLAFEFAVSWACQFRTRYELTLVNLELVFPRERLFVGTYEKIGDPQQLKALTDFLSFDTGRFDVSERPASHASYQKFDLENKKQIARAYQPTYEALGNKYPFLRSLWQGFGFISS
jgi:hypothetical protein